jgi:SAM-dependent methyltransferase
MITTEAALFAAATEHTDWLARWEAMVVAEHAQSERVMADLRSPARDYWANHAQRYRAAVQRTPQPDAFLRTLLPHLRGSDTVLDVGAGTGRHTLYLAGQVARVVALEPSAAMRTQLEQQLAAANTANVDVVAAAWPTTDVPTADVVFAAHVIYSVRQIGPFFQAMSVAAGRVCFLAAGVRQPSFVTAPFWERVYGEPRLPLPGAVECLGALRQLGLHPQATLLATPSYSFADSEDALGDLRSRLHVAPGSPHDAALQHAIADLIVPDGTGRLVSRVQAEPTAAIWWAANVV